MPPSEERQSHETQLNSVEEELRYLLKSEGLTVERIRRRSTALAELQCVHAHMRHTGTADPGAAIRAVIECAIDLHLEASTDQLLLNVLFNRSAKEGDTLDKRMAVSGRQLRGSSGNLRRSAVHERMRTATRALASVLLALAGDPCGDGSAPASGHPATPLDELEAQADRVAAEIRTYLLLLARQSEPESRSRTSSQLLKHLPLLEQRFRESVPATIRMEALAFMAVGLTDHGQREEVIEVWDLLSSAPGGLASGSEWNDVPRVGITVRQARDLAEGLPVDPTDEVVGFYRRRGTTAAEVLAAQLVRLEDSLDSYLNSGPGGLSTWYDVILRELLPRGSVYAPLFVDPQRVSPTSP